MIPVRDDVIKYVDFVKRPTDTPDEIKYKDLLDREYAFCVSVSGKILDRVNRIYDKQMKTGKVLKFGCDFKKLEVAMMSYTK